MEDTFRVRLLVPSAPRSGAALRQGLRASSRRSHRPTGKSKRQKRTHEWIKLGCKFTAAVACHDPILEVFPNRFGIRRHFSVDAGDPADERNEGCQFAARLTSLVFVQKRISLPYS